ncbi:MAG: hypothetical protein IPJ43_20555 [Saprospiraceae bacterium]|nr:hypothetical protein [Saprospiraceae bacterium]
MYTIKSFTDDFGCGGTILNPSAEVIVSGTLPVITNITGPIEYICGDSIVCHDLDTLIDVEINGSEIVHVTWYTKSPKVVGFNPATDSVPFGIIKLKDTTEYFLIYTDPLTMCTVCDSTIVNADFLSMLFATNDKLSCRCDL